MLATKILDGKNKLCEPFVFLTSKYSLVLPVLSSRHGGGDAEARADDVAVDS